MGVVIKVPFLSRTLKELEDKVHKSHYRVEVERHGKFYTSTRKEARDLRQALKSTFGNPKVTLIYIEVDNSGYEKEREVW